MAGKGIDEKAWLERPILHSLDWECSRPLPLRPNAIRSSLRQLILGFFPNRAAALPGALGMPPQRSYFVLNEDGRINPNNRSFMDCTDRRLGGGAPHVSARNCVSGKHPDFST